MGKAGKWERYVSSPKIISFFLTQCNLLWPPETNKKFIWEKLNSKIMLQRATGSYSCLQASIHILSTFNLKMHTCLVLAILNLKSPQSPYLLSKVCGFQIKHGHGCLPSKRIKGVKWTWLLNLYWQPPSLSMEQHWICYWNVFHLKDSTLHFHLKKPKSEKFKGQ